MAADPPLTRSLARFGALLAALGAGPLDRPALLERLGDAYPSAPDSARRMLARDIAALAQLGIQVEVSRARPPLYTLRGGTPLFQPEELRALGLIRDSFGDRHPQAAAIHALLATLTAELSQPQQAEYARRQATRAPLQPAIDYTPHAATIARIELAISRREIIRFRYTSSRGEAGAHEAEPYEIEYYERHFYLVAYHLATRQLLDYRVDRVSGIDTVQTLPPHLSRARERRPIRKYGRLNARRGAGPCAERLSRGG